MDQAAAAWWRHRDTVSRLGFALLVVLVVMTALAAAVQLGGVLGLGVPPLGPDDGLRLAPIRWRIMRLA